MGQEKRLKILYITFSSIDMNTSATIRNKALIKGLVQNGASVDLMTLSAENSNNYFDNIVDYIDGVNIIRVKQNSLYLSMVNKDNSLKGMLKKKVLPLARKIYHCFNLFDNTIFIAKNVENKSIQKKYYDLIISSSDPKSSHIAAEKLIESGLEYGKWIQYWGDPLAIDITKKSLHPKWYARRVEDKILSSADRIVYVSPFTLTEQKRIFLNHAKKMMFLPIPYLKPKLIGTKKDSCENITLGYFGDYNSTVRDIQPLYRYCKNTGKNLLIAGNSDLSITSNENIRIYSRLKQEEIAKLENESEILVCILNKRGTQIPGKIYHYAATNKPILVILDGEYKKEIAEYLNSFNRFVLCDNIEDDIERAINIIINKKEKWEPSPYFCPELIGRKFIEILTDITREREEGILND